MLKVILIGIRFYVSLLRNWSRIQSTEQRLFLLCRTKHSNAIYFTLLPPVCKQIPDNVNSPTCSNIDTVH